MSSTKYIRTMSFGELVRSAIKIYRKTVWPFWVIILLTYLVLDFIYLSIWTVIGESTMELWLVFFILLPVFFIGPSLLAISNVVLERPRKTFLSFSKGMSPGLVLRIILYFSPGLAAILVVSVLGLVGEYYPYIFLLFTVPLLLFAPLWVFYPMILLLEKKGTIESIGRTMIFISGQIKRLFQIQMLLTVLTGLLLPLGIFYYTVLYRSGSNTLVGSGFDANYIFFDYIAGGLYYTVPIVLGLSNILYVFHYYQVRAEKENFSEELLAQELGYQPIEEMMTV